MLMPLSPIAAAGIDDLRFLDPNGAAIDIVAPHCEEQKRQAGETR